MKKRYIFIISFLLALFVCVAFVGCDGNGGETDAVTPPEKLGELVFSKISERRTALTLNEGEEITYVITVENRNGYSVKLPVVDELPENTTFVSGDVTPSGKDISFFAELSAGETKKFSYKVKVNEDMGSERKILPATAKIYDKTAECNENYVGQTFSLLDEKYMTKGINAVEYSENVDPALVEYAQSLGKPVLAHKTGSEYADACSKFYNKLCEEQ